MPINEDHPLNPQSPYAATKVGADQIALSYYRSFGTPVTVLRPFNTYGPRQSARAVIPTVITQIAAARETGTPCRIELGATRPTRDFTFVTDTVEAFVRAAAGDAALGEVINVGADFEISIADTAALIAELMGVEATVESATERLRPAASEVERLWCDNGKAADLIGWRPALSGPEGFRRGLARTVEWFRDAGNRAGYKAHLYNV